MIGRLGHLLLDFLAQIWTQGTLRHILGPILVIYEVCQIWSNAIQCKNRKFFYWRVTGALFWVKNIKVPFVIGHPPTYTSNLVYMCAGGFRGHKSSTELNYLDSFKSYCNSSNSGFLSSGGGAGGLGVSGVINFSLYEFRNVQR